MRADQYGKDLFESQKSSSTFGRIRINIQSVISKSLHFLVVFERYLDFNTVFFSQNLGLSGQIFIAPYIENGKKNHISVSIIW